MLHEVGFGMDLNGRGGRDHAAQRHLPAVLHDLLQRGAERALAARHRERRLPDLGRDDRAWGGLRSRGHLDPRGQDRGRLDRQRRQDVHHQRHQLRSGDRGGAHQPGGPPWRLEPAGRGARDGGLRARAQPREGGLAQCRHRRDVLPGRVRPRGEPARRGGHGLPLPDLEPAAGATRRWRSRPWSWRAPRSSTRSST